MAAPVVVILAAGHGTRMRSSVHKLLHPLCGRPMISWPIAAARTARLGTVVVVDGPERALEAVVGDGVRLVVQEEPRGTGDAVKAAADEFTTADMVLVLLGDAPLVSTQTLQALAAAHERSDAVATIGTVELADPRGYGRVVRGADGTVERVVETKAAGDASSEELAIREVNTGMFVFDGDALRGALQQLGSDNAQGEQYLPDVLPVMRAAGHSIEAFALADPTELLGVNDRRQLAQVTAVAQRRICEGHQLSGVTIVDPAATVIDVDVEIGPDTVVAPFTSLLGRTRIGSGSTVGPSSTLIDATVGDGATLLHAYVTGATVGDRVSVGPFAYLRPGTVMREGSKAGTFVEIKNSDVGAGTKVPHLSYIGDAEIGEQTNLGAATITANYDGYRKNPTKIGSRVKTSVDTTLMAPVVLGDDTFTAAGSVIGQDVPDGALGGSPGVARGAQRNVEGYAKRRAERAEQERAERERVAEERAARERGRQR